MMCNQLRAALRICAVLIFCFASTAQADKTIDASPLLTTPGDPLDPRYANAGANLRNGVGSIFIGFASGSGFICTATAIGSQHILTAAHCLRNGADSVAELLFVLNAGLPSALILPATSFSVHPLYDVTEPFYGAFAHGDLAVVELAESLPPWVETYPLNTSFNEFGKTARHYGHGRAGKGTKGATEDADFFYGRTGLNRYEQVLEPFLGDGLKDQLLMDFDSGGRKHNAMDWWFSTDFNCHPANPNNPPQAQDGQCTTFKSGLYPDFKGFRKNEIGVAPGDSGGPSFIDGKIAGVHSFGFTHNCAGVTNGTDFDCELNSTYGEMSGDTRVSFYAGWITAQTQQPGASLIPEQFAVAAEASNEANQLSATGRSFVSGVVSATLRLELKGPAHLGRSKQED